MKYDVKILQHFFNPKNVGFFQSNEYNVKSAVVGSYENGALIHLQAKIDNNRVIAAKFKAYGNVIIIATCSFVTEWLTDKTVKEGLELTSRQLMLELNIPEIKIHCALLVEEALRRVLSSF